MKIKPVFYSLIVAGAAALASSRSALAADNRTSVPYYLRGLGSAPAAATCADGALSMGNGSVSISLAVEPTSNQEGPGASTSWLAKVSAGVSAQEAQLL